MYWTVIYTCQLGGDKWSFCQSNPITKRANCSVDNCIVESPHFGQWNFPLCNRRTDIHTPFPSQQMALIREPDWLRKMYTNPSQALVDWVCWASDVSLSIPKRISTGFTMMRTHWGEIIVAHSPIEQGTAAKHPWVNASSQRLSTIQSVARRQWIH